MHKNRLRVLYQVLITENNADVIHSLDPALKENTQVHFFRGFQLQVYTVIMYVCVAAGNYDSQLPSGMISLEDNPAQGLVSNSYVYVPPKEI